MNTSTSPRERAILSVTPAKILRVTAGSTCFPFYYFAFGGTPNTSSLYLFYFNFRKILEIEK